jgi:hypothetical protein
MRLSAHRRCGARQRIGDTREHGPGEGSPCASRKPGFGRKSDAGRRLSDRAAAAATRFESTSRLLNFVRQGDRRGTVQFGCLARSRTGEVGETGVASSCARGPTDKAACERADASPLAPGTAAGTSSRPSPEARSSSARCPDTQPDRAYGEGEPALGLRAHPGRVAQARDQRLGHDDRDRAAELGPRAGAAADRQRRVARVATSARRARTSPATPDAPASRSCLACGARSPAPAAATPRPGRRTTDASTLASGTRASQVDAIASKPWPSARR